MTSELKSATARLNGAKSRGPRTAAGLEKSARNSLCHGFTARKSVLLACENPEEFQQILNEYTSIYAPATPAEADLVDEMVAARWRIRRLWTIETSLMDARMIRQRATVDATDPGIQLAEAFRSLADDSRSLALASRYESRLHRVHERAYQTLRELQEARDSKIKKYETNPSQSQAVEQPPPPTAR
jgi:hypothetical protein